MDIYFRKEENLGLAEDQLRQTLMQCKDGEDEVDGSESLKKFGQLKMCTQEEEEEEEEEELVDASLRKKENLCFAEDQLRQTLMMKMGTQEDELVDAFFRKSASHVQEKNLLI
ncbi:hypothetical protein F2P81_021575 [Scophthalmus maximus]|uniref:Uncharacterized protein n=1 Tax=Scophthalmus maximus TaxID=52904 RepID=A0A6A4S3U7_SCOMX|nr:hypothetical protein F2P81_021575 [Scophthalmus maximus]